MENNNGIFNGLKAVNTEGIDDLISNEKTNHVSDDEKNDSKVDEKEIMKMLETFQKTSASLPKKEYGRAYKKKRKKRVKEQKKSRRLNR